VGEFVVAVVSVVIAAGSLSIAMLQYLLARQKSANEKERLTNLAERLRTAETAANAGVEAANLIVQRTKEPDATLAEVQNLARLTRGTLALLRDQLAAEERQIVSQQDVRQHYSSAAAAPDSDDS